MLHKNKLEDLALFGGAPAFSDPVHVGRPNIGDRNQFLRRVNDMLDRRWFSNNGPYVQELESAIARLTGVEHCIAVCNATIGLEIALQAMGLSGEVILPSFTFVATAHVVQRLGLTPVFCDVDPLTHNIDPCRVAELITPQTSAIMGVHLWGRACNIAALEQLAQQHNLKLLFDAAHGFGCGDGGRMIGAFGNAEVFSFHATKFFNTFEGGAIVTNDAALAHKARLMTNFGFAGYDSVVELGTNGKMSEIAAAMGLTGLDCLGEFIETNRLLYKQYERGLAEVPGVRLVHYDESQRNNYQYIVLELDSDTFGINRDQLVQLLWAENVLARRYFYPGCHRMEPYRTLYPEVGVRLPVTERLARDVMVLPTGTALSAANVEDLCRIMGFVAARSRAVNARFKEMPQP